jgi:hypothetical protein
MSRTVHLWVVVSPRELDRFMHAADLFEPFKALISPTPLKLEVTLKPRTPLRRVFKNLIRALKTHADFRPVMALVPGQLVWFDPEVKSVSTGHQWGPIAALPAALGWSELLPTAQPISL